jgi:hypothetical protein
LEAPINTNNDDFEKKYWMKKTKAGTGVGLYIHKEINIKKNQGLSLKVGPK